MPLFSSTKQKDTTLAAVFLLIFLDLLESGSDKWNFHLEGAKNLITLDQRPPGSHTGVNQGAGRTVQEIRDFITRQIYLVETLGGTFVRPGLLSQFTTLDQFGRQLPEVVEQSFVGCPEFLLNAVQYILRQRDAIAGLEPLTKTTVHNRVQEITAVLESIQKFDCYLWASSLPQPQSLKRDLKNLCTLSETWKISALIYGQRVLDIHTNDVSPQDNLVCQLIELIGALKDDELYKSTQCYNTINAAKILQAYWQQESQQEPFSPQWIFDIGHLGRDWLLI
ncbi:hypothetical protein EYZ11_001485 [Aspergillus tanneri]|uniref:Uncharacterized protein n=1 Tax=Aspergillus tanneri TaxID=1220188 RepID=A0A4S3JUE6_9EURO|nr:hypothetical protein EYZ11_001485 [Aspergillus tanneri]